MELSRRFLQCKKKAVDRFSWTRPAIKLMCYLERFIRGYRIIDLGNLIQDKVVWTEKQMRQPDTFMLNGVKSKVLARMYDAERFGKSWEDGRKKEKKDRREWKQQLEAEIFPYAQMGLLLCQGIMKPFLKRCTAHQPQLNGLRRAVSELEARGGKWKQTKRGTSAEVVIDLVLLTNVDAYTQYVVKPCVHV